MWMELSALALVALFGLGFLVATAAAWHYRRWVAYHHRKGLPVPGSPRAVLGSELGGGAQLAWWFFVGLGHDGVRSPANPTGPLVLCVHGYTQNGSNFVGIRRGLEAAGRPTMAVSLRHRVAPMSWYVARLEVALVQALDHADEIDVVCHSMGGVLLRCVLERRPDLVGRVRLAVTLGTPHSGTAAARGIPLLPEVQALKRRSQWLAELPSLTTLVPRVVTVAGTLDTVVYPVSSALLDDAEHVIMPAGHAGLLTTPSAIEAVLCVVIGHEPSP